MNINVYLFIILILITANFLLFYLLIDDILLTDDYYGTGTVYRYERFKKTRYRYLYQVLNTVRLYPGRYCTLHD
jgi:hypothetical protein